jgi:aminodeoxyfutalosine synthase
VRGKQELLVDALENLMIGDTFMSRISSQQALELYDLNLPELGKLAQQIKENRHGKKVSFIKTYYMNFTNICKYACKYCGFRRNKADKDAYTLNLQDIEKKILSCPEKNLKEIWLSSGLNVDLPFSYYIDMLKMLKKIIPSANIKAFTAVEIDFFAKRYEKSHEQVLDQLLEAGLDRIPGGGAEIFDDHIRKKIDIKTRTKDYLKIHSLCHKRNIPTNITMLFGHIEKREHRIKHLQILRDFQDESKGVQAFIPLAYQDQHNPLAKRGVKGPSPVEILKTLAISRIFLDNIDHIQSFWIDSGVETTQISLHFGVDDINGTIIEENIAHSSGSTTSTYESTDNLIRWIKGAEMIPIERDSNFNFLREY